MTGRGATRASAQARRLADELDVDLARVRGTGPDGRIGRADVLAAAAGLPSGTPAADVPSTPPSTSRDAPVRSGPSPDSDRAGEPLANATRTVRVDGAAALVQRLAAGGTPPAVAALVVRAVAHACDDPAMAVGIALPDGAGLHTHVVHRAGTRTLHEITDAARTPELLPDAGVSVTVVDLEGLRVDGLARPPIGGGWVLTVGRVRCCTDARDSAAGLVTLTITAPSGAGHRAAALLGRVADLIEAPGEGWTDGA